MRKLVQISNRVFPKPGEAARHSGSTNRSSQKQSTDTKLCDSCRQLRQVIEDPWSTTTGSWSIGGSIGIVDEASPNARCPLCVQISAVLASLLAEGKVHPVYDSTDRRALLEPHYLHGRTWRSIYFTLLSPRSTPLIYLFPRHAVLVHKDTGRKQHVPFAEIIKPAYIRDGLFRAWVGFCQQCHVSCKDTSGKDFHPKALIDCERKQLCYNVREPYACLSYVWGGHNEHPNSVGEELLQDLPQTVSDALTVTLKLGIHYLWVDRYCIDQNDVDEKHNAIRQMDAIYHGAMITIIAAAGNNADHGLPGISRPRDTQHIIDIAGKEFIAIENPVQSIFESTWNTRGWTFQESLLSRRRLVFTGSQTYFQCMEMQCLESLDQLGKMSDLSLKEAFRVFPTNGIGLLPNGLYDRLQEYYHRRLSYATDAISAFEGIFQAFQKLSNQQPHMRVSHFYGIPFFTDPQEKRRANSTFALHLAWKLHNAHLTSLSLEGYHHEGVLPTWSWAWSKVRLEDVHNINRLQFKFRAAESQKALYSTEVDIYLTHMSGARMDLNTYVEEGYDYIQLRPWIDITSWTITGRFVRWSGDGPRLGPMEFSGIPRAKAYLRLNQVEIGRNISAVYLGSNFTYNVPHTTIVVEMAFLLVELLFKGHYKCVGVCSKPHEIRHATQEELVDIMKELEWCSNGQPWQRETLRLE